MRREAAISIWVFSWCSVLSLILGFGLVGCGKHDATESQTLRIAHPLDVQHPNHEALEFFARDLAERSGGRMKTELYPGGQLGSDRECLELLQIGSLDMTFASAAVIESFVPDFKLFGLPYLFESREQRLEQLSGPLGQQLLESAIPFRLRGLQYFDAGSRSFYTKDAVVKSPDDLVGLKVRVLASPMAIKTVRALGASPTPISWGELYTALQQGVVDAAENNPPSLLTSRHYEITPFFSMDEHSAIPDVMMFSEVSWQRLSDQEKAWLSASARAAAEYQYSIWNEAEQNALEQLEAQGVTIYRPDKGPFMEAVQPLYQEFKEANPELAILVEDLRK